MNEEYIYDIGKYTIVVDKVGKDEVALSIAKIENEDLYVLGSYYGENAECIDLIIKENQQLKEQLKMIKKTTNELLTYLDKNKSVLNNPNILDFYINIKEILKIAKGE